ncbi:MAG: hypothetical protein K2H30_03285 [Clostridia bacterium]|nr:hypothetical protein [Clostridia bacterium]
MRRVLNIILTVILTMGFILLGVFVFRSSYIRLGYAFKDFGLSVAYYFCVMFGISHNIIPTVNSIPEVQTPQVTLPTDFEGFKNSSAQYFSLLIDKGNFDGWLAHLSVVMTDFAKVLVIVLPCIVAFVFIIKAIYKRGNNRHGVDTVPLKVFKFLSKITYQPIKRFIVGYVEFIRSHSWIWICWVIIWVLNFNLVTIIVEFVAYYFYFAVEFDFSTIYTQFVKLFADLKTPFIYFPYWALLFIIYPLFDRFRKRIATARLRHYEARNCGFINELPIVSMTCGSMGKKKTTAITDMALSQEVMFRQKAFDILQKSDMKFPMFPWILFEKALQAEMENGNVYNLATVKCWAISLEERGELFGYDGERYGLINNDGLKEEDIYSVLSTYAQAYFIYIIESSLIVSNYSIREDNLLIDSGNFPMWLTDFFPTNFRRDSRHAHILDFDILRLGKKVLDENPNAGSFEFGVIGITEIGKERGNNLELQEKKKNADEANQKNDKFNSWLKMCRHSATVDNFPFIKVFADEQRPESWGADARDLCDIVNIVSSGELKLAMPFYTIGDMLAEWAFNRFIGLYYDFRFRRGDNTLLVHILKSVTAWLWKRNIKIYNRYGFSVLKIEKERGTMDGKVSKKKYYLMSAKIYRKRFATDCFADYFNDMALRTNVGLNDYREYLTECASVDELQAQNSYFINALYGLGGDG